MKVAYLSQQIFENRMHFLSVRDLGVEVMHSLTDFQRSDEASKVFWNEEWNQSMIGQEGQQATDSRSNAGSSQ